MSDLDRAESHQDESGGGRRSYGNELHCIAFMALQQENEGLRQRLEKLERLLLRHNGEGEGEASDSEVGRKKARTGPSTSQPEPYNATSAHNAHLDNDTALLLNESHRRMMESVTAPHQRKGM